MTVFDFEKHQKEEQSQSTKLTAQRLAEVTNIQQLMQDVGGRLNTLAIDESHGWVPGTPQTERTYRVEPIEALAKQLEAGIDLLERLYS